MTYIARKSVHLIIAFFILIAISALPSLVVQTDFNLTNYWNGIQQQMDQLQKLEDITYYNITAQRYLPLLPALGPLVKESVIIFTTALAVSTSLGLMYAYFYYRSGRRVRTVLHQTSQTLEIRNGFLFMIMNRQPFDKEE